MKPLLIDKNEKRLFIKSVLRGDRKMVEHLLDGHIPKGDCVPLFWIRDADGDYIPETNDPADDQNPKPPLYKLTPAEFERLNAKYPCY